MKKALITSVLLLSSFTSLPGFAEGTEESTWWKLQYSKEPERPRSDFLTPLLSLFAPGVNQLWENQTAAGAAYLGYYLLGQAQVGNQLNWVSKQIQANPDILSNLTSRNDHVRQLHLGNQMSLFAGEMSAYHSFRSAVESRRSLGEYEFFHPHETATDLLKAPFQFEFLKRKSTWIPLGVGVALGLLQVSTFSTQTGPKSLHFTGTDAADTMAYSFQAGVGEEAAFRGSLMPYLANQGLSPQTSNLLTSILFGAAHTSNKNPVPWPQFLAGYYFGQVALWNDWSIQESIFIHTWWDIIAIGTDFAVQREKKNPSVFINLIDIPISL